MQAPAWLADEAEITAMLNAVVDRFDQQAGEQRERAIVLPIARYLTSLARNDARADHTWEFILKLEQAAVLSVRAGRRHEYDPPWQSARAAFYPDSEPILREWLARPALESVMLQWRRVVEHNAHLFPGDRQALLSRRIVVPGRAAEEVVAALARLREITSSASLRQLSTFAFWGDSKVLDERADLVTTLFPQLLLRERPIVVAVYLPETIRATLFIENQDTYTTALDGLPAAAGEHALVYLAGFKGAAARIRNHDGARLHFAGPGAAVHGAHFEAWWFDATSAGLPTYFWGDLDFSGMQILKSLRARFADVTAWQPGYLPMLEQLRTSSPSVAGLQTHQQVDPITSGCAFADTELLPAIREFGFWHQEHPF